MKMRNPDGKPHLDNWADVLCLREFAPWLNNTPDRAALADGLAYYNATHRSVFLLGIDRGSVRLLEKPGFRVREEFNDSSAVIEDDTGLIYKEEFIRALMYRTFFERVLAFLRRPLTATLAIDVNDDPVQDVTVPIFAFQKRRGSNTVLVPDVDFLHSHFYLSAEYRDTIPYRNKSPTAIFAGSTTAGRSISVDDVRSLSIPRLRSAVFFRDKEGVDFRLPRIVQCASPSAEAMIEELGFGKGHCSWAEQFGHRLILSMDGNGATCSRVAVALKSNAVLVKYDSPNCLYYFGELVPWRHFIPVSSDETVLDLVQAEARRPGIFASVAAEGRAFAEAHLSRQGVAAYTAALLAWYAERVCGLEPDWAAPGGEDGSARASDAAPRSTGLEVEAGAHIQGLGDVWAWPDEWAGECGTGRAIEAIVVVLGSPLAYEDLEYRVVLADGVLSEWVRGGELCGTRGQNRPLRGFCMRLSPSAAAEYCCVYQASFVGDGVRGPFQAGDLCASGSDAPLEAFRVELFRRSGQDV